MLKYLRISKISAHTQNICAHLEISAHIQNICSHLKYLRISKIYAPQLKCSRLCGPAVYFVLTHGDLQQREWTFCYSVVQRVEKYSLGGSYR